MTTPASSTRWDRGELRLFTVVFLAGLIGALIGAVAALVTWSTHPLGIVGAGACLMVVGYGSAVEAWDRGDI